MPSYANPQNLNRYSYVINNPLRYTDPTGHVQYEDDVYTDSDGDCKNNGKACFDLQERIKKKKDKDQEKRDPDYVTLNVGVSIPGLGTLVSGQGVLTLDRYGNLYFGLGLALGPEAPLGLSASVSPGFLDTWSNALDPFQPWGDHPDQQESEQILSGWFGNTSICYIFCGGLTNSLSNPSNVGFEVVGIGVPQLSAGAGYTWLIDLTDREEPIW